MLIIIFVRFINLPAWLVLGVWIAGQFVAVPSALAGADGGVAYFAHIGGFIAGMCLVPFFKRSDVPCSARTTHRQTLGRRAHSLFRNQAAGALSLQPQGNDPLGSRVVVKDEDASPWAKPPARKNGRRKSGSVPRFRKPPEGDG